MSFFKHKISYLDLDYETSTNEDLIKGFNKYKIENPSFNEPNYKLAEKVFRDFNDFNLKNINEIHHMYLKYIPKCFLPYPKNYIKCAYYLFLENAKRHNDSIMYNLIRETGCGLWLGDYPDYEEYIKKLDKKNNKDENIKRWYDEKVFSDYDPKPKELFKKKYGMYEISEEYYNSFPNSIDATDEKIIHDFGVLPEIEKEIDMNN